MPAEEIKTHITSSRARQWVGDVLAVWEEVSTLEERRRETQKEVLRARYRFGREVAAAVQAADEADVPESGTDLKREIAQRRDRTKRWVSKHVRFYQKCIEEYPGWDTEAGLPVDGYIQKKDEQNGKLTWRAACKWASEPSETEKARSALDRQVKDVEKAAETLDERLSTLKEQKEQVDGQRPDVEGVETVAEQTLDDVERTLQDLPDAAPSREEDPAYLDYIRSRACISCGDASSQVDPHHLDRGGTGTKGSDHLTVPLCRACHNRLHDMAETEFWEINPWKRAARLQDQYISALLA